MDFFDLLLTLSIPTVLVVIGGILILTLVFDEVFGNKLRPGSQKRATILGCTFIAAGILFAFLGRPTAQIDSVRENELQATIIALRQEGRPTVTSGQTPASNASSSSVVVPTTSVPTTPTDTPTKTTVLPTPTDTPVPPTSTDTPVPPTPVPPTPNPNLLFSDNFAGNLMPDWMVEQGEWRVAKDQVVIAKRVGTNTRASIGSSDWENYTVDFDAGNFNHDWGSGSNMAITVHVHVQDTGNSISFFITNNGTSCGINKNGGFTKLDGTGLQGLMGDVGRISTGGHHIQISARNNQYLLLVDGGQFCSFSDSTFTTGSVALATRSYSDNDLGQEIWLDNVVIRKR